MVNTLVLTCMAIVCACGIHRSFSPQVLSILSVQHPSRKLVEWSQSLAELDLELRFRSHKVNVNACSIQSPSGWWVG